MPEPQSITVDELLAEFDRLGIGPSDNPEFKTTSELAEEWGTSIDRTLRLLKKGVKHNLVQVGRKRTTRVDGISTLVAAYKLTLSDPGEKQPS